MCIEICSKLWYVCSHEVDVFTYKSCFGCWKSPRRVETKEGYNTAAQCPVCSLRGSETKDFKLNFAGFASLSSGEQSKHSSTYTNSRQSGRLSLTTTHGSESHEGGSTAIHPAIVFVNNKPVDSFIEHNPQRNSQRETSRLPPRVDLPKLDTTLDWNASDDSTPTGSVIGPEDHKEQPRTNPEGKKPAQSSGAVVGKKVTDDLSRAKGILPKDPVAAHPAFRPSPSLADAQDVFSGPSIAAILAQSSPSHPAEAQAEMKKPAPKNLSLFPAPLEPRVQKSAPKAELTASEQLRRWSPKYDISPPPPFPPPEPPKRLSLEALTSSPPRGKFALAALEKLKAGSPTTPPSVRASDNSGLTLEWDEPETPTGQDAPRPGPLRKMQSSYQMRPSPARDSSLDQGKPHAPRRMASTPALPKLSETKPTRNVLKKSMPPASTSQRPSRPPSGGTAKPLPSNVLAHQAEKAGKAPRADTASPASGHSEVKYPSTPSTPVSVAGLKHRMSKRGLLSLFRKSKVATSPAVLEESSDASPQAAAQQPRYKRKDHNGRLKIVRRNSPVQTATPLGWGREFASVKACRKAGLYEPNPDAKYFICVPNLEKVKKQEQLQEESERRLAEKRAAQKSGN